MVTATPGGAGGGASLTPFGAEVTMGTGRPWLRRMFNSSEVKVLYPT